MSVEQVTGVQAPWNLSSAGLFSVISSLTQIFLNLLVYFGKLSSVPTFD